MQPPALILTCEHAANRVPAAWRALFRGRRALLESHRGYDPGALALARELSRRLAAPLWRGRHTRLLVDLNRAPHNPRCFSAITRALPRAQRERLLDQYHRPHRETVTREVEARLAQGLTVCHIGVHTFTPVLRGKTRNARVGLLYDPARGAEKDLCLAWAAALQRARPNLRIRRNYPYRGTDDGLTTTLRHAFPQHSYLGIELEVNQRLATAAPHVVRALARALAQSLRDALDTLLR